SLSTRGAPSADLAPRSCQGPVPLILMDARMHEGHRVSAAADLIAGIARGDRGDFERFYDAYAALAFGLIRRILRDPEAAKEVLQEVFWQIWQDAPSYDPSRGSPEAWLVMRAKTRAIDKLRAIRRREQTFVAPADERVAAAPEARRDDPALAARDGGMGAGCGRRPPAAQAGGSGGGFSRGPDPEGVWAPSGRAPRDGEDTHPFGAR